MPGFQGRNRRHQGLLAWVAGTNEKEMDTERTGFPQVFDGESPSEISFRGASRDSHKKPDLQQCDYPAEYRLASEPDAALLRLPGFDPTQVSASLPITPIYQDIAHWFVYAGFSFLIAGITVRII